MEIEHLVNECVETMNVPDPFKFGASGMVGIYFEDKCKPVIDYYEYLGWNVTSIHQGTSDRKKDIIDLRLDFFQRVPV
jgi:hypothetical protein